MIWETEIPTAVNVIGSTFVGLVLTIYPLNFVYTYMIYLFKHIGARNV